MQDGVLFSEDQIRRNLCLRSFKHFVRNYWDVIVNQPLVWNWHMDYICDQLQKVAERVMAGLPKKYDLVINVPPGTSKSIICSQMFPAWVWARKDTCSFLCTSYTEKLALRNAQKSRELIRSSRYQAAFPLGEMKKDQDLKSHFENQSGGARISFGTGGSTGFHAHFIIIDDPLNPTEAASETELASCIDWLDGTLSTRLVDKAVSVTILIMQRLHEGDPTGHLISREDAPVRHIRLPGELADGKAEVKPGKLRRFYSADGLLDEKRLGRRELKQLRAKLGEYGYAGQILQNPTPPSGGMFKTDRLIADVPSVAMIRRCRYWDKAATPDSGDWCVGALLGEDINHRWWILDIVRGQWDTARREEMIANTARRDGPGVIIGVEQEPGSGGKDSAFYTVSNLAGYSLRIVRPSGSKILRADPFSVQANAGNVSFLQGQHWEKALMAELKFFPLGLHDDQVDALSGAFFILTGGFRRKRVGALLRRRRSFKQIASSSYTGESQNANHPTEEEIKRRVVQLTTRGS